MNDLIRRKDVEQMLTALGGCDASDEESRGWDNATDAALYGLRTIKNEDNTQYKWTPFTLDKNDLLDCKRPLSDQGVLVSNGDSMWIDRIEFDGEKFCLHMGGYTLIGLAWYPLPEPWEGDSK